MLFPRAPLPLILALVLTLLPGLPAHGEEPVLAPDWTLETADGNALTLSRAAQEQPVTLLLFWATWCPYCKALMPHLQSIRLEYGDPVRVLALNFKEDGDPRAVLTSSGFDFTLLLDAESVADAYDIKGTPGVLLVDGQRRIWFDLRELRPPASLDPGESAGHRRRAAYRAPYWAAEIRKVIDRMLAARSTP